ncbi:MAG: hypothetical protein IPM42_07360 [Saprospiraceae bacterium]|nr:hypothetical protein [Saprospiraceae bacterium]
MLKILKENLIWILLLCGVSLNVSAQSFWFGAKAGAAVNYQSWGQGLGQSINRDPLFSLNGDLFIESFDEFNKGSLYAQLGYHTRGSSVRFVSFNNAFASQQGFKFNNVVLELGARKAFDIGKSVFPYYLLGLRGEYTVSTNLDDYLIFGSLFYPINDFVRKFNYGVTFGGGFTKPITDLSDVFAEFSISPDLSFQYEQPPLFGIIEPFTQQRINLELRQVRNLSVEFKIGIKFLRKVEYID